MHELSLIESALGTVFERARAAHAKRILRIGMRIGALTNVVPEALQFAFEAAVRKTIAEEAKLEVELVPLVLRCRTCNNEFECTPMEYLCPRCGTVDCKVVQGDELNLSFMEIETDD